MRITPKFNDYCSRIANYLYTDMGKAPETFTSENVITAMKALYFDGYTMGTFVKHDRCIREHLFHRIGDHMWGIDSYFTEAK